MKKGNKKKTAQNKISSPLIYAYGNKLKIFFGALLLVLTIKATGQINYKIEHYTTEDGLSHNNITCILKDREGFMWFATKDGIDRNDGHSITVFKVRSGKSDLRNNWIDDLFEGDTGLFLLLTHDGQVYTFNKKTERFFNLSTQINSTQAKPISFNRIYPSHEGSVWLSTSEKGLLYVPHPDPSHSAYKRYAKEERSGFQLPSNKINFFHEDKDHRVWVGTAKGLSCFEKDKTGVYKIASFGPDAPPNLQFTSIAEDTGSIWIGTGQGYLFVFNKASRKFVSKKIADSSLNAICVSKKRNVVYLSTSDRKIITVNKPGLNTSSAVMQGTGSFVSLYEDRSGLIWVEPSQHGVIKFNPADQTFKYFSQKNQSNYDNRPRSYNVFEDNTGTVWVNMKGGGFGYYNTANDSVDYFLDKPHSEDYKFSNMVRCNYLDPAGVLWLTDDYGGVNKVILQLNNFNKKVLVENSYNKSDNDVRGICNDSKKRLWISTKTGKIYIYEEGKKVANLIVNTPAAGLGLIYVLMQDSKKTIWIGTKGNGLFRADPMDKAETKYKLTHYLSDKNDINSLSDNNIYTVFEDKDGRIWVGGFEAGLNLISYKNNQIQFINARNSFINYPKAAFNRIRNIVQDAAGNIWLATTNGLLVFNPNEGDPKDYHFKRYTQLPENKESLGNNDVQVIYKDSRNTMWAATSGGGLSKIIGDPLRSLKFQVFTTQDGLPSDYINSIAEDNNGNLWLATENGLSKFNIYSNKIKNYNSSNGLQKVDFSESSSLKLPNGNLVFGTASGYLTFNPAKIINHRINAPMALTNLQINNEEVVPAKDNPFLKTSLNNVNRITLQYDNTISIVFTVLDYRSNNKTIYSYRLKGFSDTWVNADNQQKATYTNLPPGEYVFEVKSLSDDLYSNQPYKSLAITIQPPYWRTWWAYLIYLIIAGILIEFARRTASTMLTLRNRIAVERRISDLKLSFFTNISHELRTPLTLILNPIEEIYQHEKLSAQGYEYVNVVRKNATRMVRFINQLLDLRKVQSGKVILKISQVEIISFVRMIGSYFSETAYEKQIDLVITANVNELLAWVDAEKFDIVVYNLLANAFKFTPNNKTIKIVITGSEKDNTFVIDIIDQGIGVPDDQLHHIFELYYEVDRIENNHLKGTGIGLALSKELIELHHGKLCARNNKDSGLSVSIELKSGKEHYKNDEITFVDSPEILRKEQKFDSRSKLSDPFAFSQNLKDNSNSPLILLVEDNNELRKFLTIQLKEIYRVETAENGEEGLEKAATLLPDLILSDVIMPKMDGIRMLDKLKNNINTSHIPVILLTAKFSVESQIEGLKYGADDYIIKPFENNLLLASVENLLKQRQKAFEVLSNNKKPIELGPQEIFITSKDEVFLKKIIQIVEDGMVDPKFNIDTVAESIGMGRTTFYRKFKSLTNLAPVEFVRQMRLKRGKQLLDAGEDNISVIAYSVGFQNAKYFSTRFKEEFNLTPTEYLKSKGFKTPAS